MSDTIQVKNLNEQLSGPQPSRLIDVRDGDAFGDGHIPGALNIPIKRIQLNPGYVPDDKPVILYCEEGSEGSASQKGAQLLREHGHQVQVLEGGLNAWVDAGYPIEVD